MLFDWFRKQKSGGFNKRILASVDNNLNALGKVSLSQLIQFKGIGEAKAISIIAALELGGGRAEEVVELKSPSAK
jgi:DNA repair protein RadC